APTKFLACCGCQGPPAATSRWPGPDQLVPPCTPSCTALVGAARPVATTSFICTRRRAQQPLAPSVRQQPSAPSTTTASFSSAAPAATYDWCGHRAHLTPPRPSCIPARSCACAGSSKAFPSRGGFSWLVVGSAVI